MGLASPAVSGTSVYANGLMQLSSWGWARGCSKHVEDSNKHIIEETVRQVGYLPELYSGKDTYVK